MTGLLEGVVRRYLRLFDDATFLTLVLSEMRRRQIDHIAIAEVTIVRGPTGDDDEPRH